MAEDGEFQRESARDIKIGRYILIDGIPCKVVEIDTSKPGKHGAAKMRLTAIGIFEGQKKSMILPTTADAEVPIIKKEKASVVSVSGENAQLMDAETYEVYDIKIPEEYQGKLVAGREVEVIKAMGRRALSRVY